MKSTLLACVALFGFSLSAQAHEIWIERDGTGPVRVYFGEPTQEVLDHGHDEIKRIVKPNLFGTSGKAGALTRSDDHLSAPLKGDGDAWLADDAVFEPWKAADGSFETVSYYARAGRSSTAAKLDFELVPQSAGGNVLTLQYRGKPLADTEVTVIDPQKWTKTLKSDAAGKVTLPTLRSGRHIVVANHKEQVSKTIAGKDVKAVYHITTLTFAAK